MRLMVIDPGMRSGIASGISDEMPRIEAVILRKKGEKPHVQARNLGCFLRDRWSLSTPDLCVIEDSDNPAAYISADAALSQILCHGAVHALAGTFGVLVEEINTATFRAHFCGQKSAAPKRRGPRTSQQKREDREATNNMVLKRAITLGYLPHGSVDWDKASAAAMWDYAAATFARVRPRELVLFGEAANG